MQCFPGEIVKRPTLTVVAVLALIGVGLLGYWLGRQQGPATTTHVASAPMPASPSSAHPTTPAPAPAPPEGFAFARLLIDSKGDNPEACLRFTQPLQAQAEAHYGDYLKLDPAFSPALRTVGTDLCLGGLGFGHEYKVTLRRGLPSAKGERLAADTDVDVSLSDRAPLVAISGDGFILPRGQSNGLAIQTINVDKLKIHVLRMSDRMLPDQIAKGQTDAEANPLHQQSFETYSLRNLARNMASVVWTGTMIVPPDHNRTAQTAFPLQNVIPDGQHGAYLVVAEDAATAMPESMFKPGDDEAEEDMPYGQVAAHWVISTDIALTTLTGQDGLHVIARSLTTAEPMGGVKISLLATGLDELGNGTTGSDGRLDFPAALMRGKGAASANSLVAYGAEGDFAVLDLSRPAFDFSDRGVGGRPSPQPMEAFLYADRGIYRPGETVQLTTLLRDRTGHAIESTPVTLVLRRPDGIESKRYTLDKLMLGGAAQPIALAASAARGLWSVDALVDPAAPPVGHVQFDVQDFVPQQLRVAAKTTATFAKADTPIEIDVDASYLYGAPAAGLTGEAEVKLVRDPTPVPAAKDYQFGLADQQQADTTQQIDLPDLDDTGHAHLSASITAPEQVQGPLKAEIRAGVFEPSGRIVNDTIELPFRTAPRLIGIHPRFDDDRVDEDANAVFDLKTFDETGAEVATRGLKWQLIREERAFDWFSENNGWTWHYHVVDHPISQGSIDTTGTGSPVQLSQPSGWGDYRLVVTDPESGAVTSIRFAAGWGSGTETADTPDKVDVVADKQSVSAGGTAHIRIKGPFAGKAELAIAGDRLFETRTIDIPADGATVDVTASADWGPGAYVLVTMYRPLAQGRAHDPVRGVGLTWLGTDASQRTLHVEVAAPEKVVPRQSITIPLKITNAGKQAYVTLAAVDEGILQLTRYQTPDPAAFFFAKRALGVDMRDDYGRLLDGSAAAGAIQEGGDESLGGAGLPVTSTKIVALFSGVVELDSRGNASVKVDIPDFEGQLRLMAVAYDKDGVGNGQATMIVRDPVIADLALPRFLSPGDTASAAVNLHNTDGAAGTYHLAVTTSGSVTLADPKPIDAALALGQQQKTAITLGGSGEGIGSVAVDLSGPAGYKLHREWQIAVRSAHYPVTLVETAQQASGESFALDVAALKPFVPGSETLSLGYSAIAGIDVPGLLQSLYLYPFGCTEQLSSTAFALLYYNDPALLGRVKQDMAVHQRVQNAIDAIVNRQSNDGEFGLWRVNDGEASAWLNVYAVDFLTRAKEAGYDVPAGALHRSFEWIRETVSHADDQEEGAYAQAPDATRAYALYVLARVGRADIGELRRLADQVGHKLDESRRNVAPVYWRPKEKGDGSLAEPLSLGHLAVSALADGRPAACPRDAERRDR